MPRIVEFPSVVQQLTHQGFVSLYYNSGAFGFGPETVVQSVGWIGADDSTIRPGALAFTRKVNPPIEPNLSELARQTWLRHLSGDAWVTPKSHWAYELDFGSSQWLPGALQAAGLSAEQVAGLSQRHDGAALAFAPDEGPAFQGLVLALLMNLFGSDFQLSFPGMPAVCTIHHHKQLWWTTSDSGLYTSIENTVPRSGTGE